MTETGGLIKKMRTEKGFTQSDLAKKLGVSSAFVNKVERGQRPWPVDRMNDLCKTLGIKKSVAVYAATKDFERRLK